MTCSASRLFRNQEGLNWPVFDRGVAGTLVRWTWTRAVFHRGYWLVTSLYLVTEADLSPFELVFIGTA